MKSYELTTIKNDLLRSVDTDIDAAVREVTKKFSSDSENNETVNAQAQINECMAHLELVSTINSVYKKQYDALKKHLDTLISSIGILPQVPSGTELELYSDNVLRFKKKKNNDSTTLDTQVLILELNRLGVSRSIIDKAIETASKNRAGNTYYIIEASE